jgi:hypothetical protein
MENLKKTIFESNKQKFCRPPFSILLHEPRFRADLYILEI